MAVTPDSLEYGHVARFWYQDVVVYMVGTHSLYSLGRQ